MLSRKILHCQTGHSPYYAFSHFAVAVHIFVGEVLGHSLALSLNLGNHCRSENLIKGRNSWLDSMFHGFYFQEVQNWNICWKWFKQILSELINFYFHWSNPICRSSPRKLDAFKSSQSVYTVEITQKIFIQTKKSIKPENSEFKFIHLLR